MSKIFVTDLDHTFLHSNQSVTKFSSDIWNQKAKTHILTVATARSFNKTHEFLKSLELKAPMILLDGSMVVTPQKKLIDMKLINKELGDAIIDEGSKFNIYPFIISLKNKATLEEAFLFPTTLNFHQKGVLQNYKNDPRMVKCTNIRAMEMNFKIVYFGDLTTLQPLTNHLKNIFGNQLEYKLSPEKYSDGYFLTILHPKADKAHALESVLEYIGKNENLVTAFGDSINDIGMFHLSGKSVAVANALDEVKDIADVVLEHTNDEDAVAKYLIKNA